METWNERRCQELGLQAGFVLVRVKIGSKRFQARFALVQFAEFACDALPKMTFNILPFCNETEKSWCRICLQSIVSI